jgi:hypothetical protein
LSKAVTAFLALFYWAQQKIALEINAVTPLTPVTPPSKNQYFDSCRKRSNH